MFVAEAALQWPLGRFLQGAGSHLCTGCLAGSGAKIYSLIVNSPRAMVGQQLLLGLLGCRACLVGLVHQQASVAQTWNLQPCLPLDETPGHVGFGLVWH